MTQLKSNSHFPCSNSQMRSCFEKSLKKMMLSMVGGPAKNPVSEMGAKMVLIQKPTEFGECSKWASVFRKTISCIDHLIHSQYFSEIGRMARSILNTDVENEKGCRSIASSQVPELLKRIVFSKKVAFFGFANEGPEVSLFSDKKTVRYSMPGFVPWHGLRWPKEFYAFRLYLVIGQLSDWVWDENNGEFRACVEGLENLTKCTVSEWMERNREPIDVVMDVSFDKPALTKPGTTVFVMMGIEVSTTARIKQDYLPAPYGTVGIIECFV